jgi:hypothetical protein
MGGGVKDSVAGFSSVGIFLFDGTPVNIFEQRLNLPSALPSF